MLAWLALLTEGRLSCGAANREVWTLAKDAGWAQVTTRSGELRLVEAHRGDVEARLDHEWPSWREDLRALTAAGLGVNRVGWQALQDNRRRARLPSALPEALNRRTAAAAVRDHAKAHIEEESFEGTFLTHDNLLRLRPHRGLRLERGTDRLDATALAAVCGEVCVSERAFLRGTRLTGTPPGAVLLIENLGVYVDLPLPEGWCAVHVPGWNTRMVEAARDAWPTAPAAIFGDLDPNGAAIVRSLRSVWPSLKWFIPSFVMDYLDRAQPKTWPQLPPDAPAAIQALALRNAWLEQEIFLLDPRLPEDLAAWMRQATLA